ncbi:TIR-like protein FxsC [Streptomyces sp. NBC_00536]|uniref:TIR-like protein FxsC n=1 Tax=Streptomyces sp. NBC_00536 TaxID=2975769 RepID=UPI002E81AFE8|nr:TIR-like protein FxsC [Streptomyces sp. NBC_00536]WUC77558.1 TIR-like protein FxsC [Streptomyces sp. NBC_00536]
MPESPAPPPRPPGEPVRAGGGGPLAAVVPALHGLGRELDGLAIAELLWLAALRRERATAAGDTGVAEGAGSPGAADPRERIGPWRPGRDVYGPSAPGGEALPAREVSVPRAAALPRAREIARALRPLRRAWTAGRSTRLDIGATVAAYARSGELLPAFRPAPERWFDLTVVLDRSPTMAVWEDAGAELVKVLASTGAFRTLRVRETGSWGPGPGTGAGPVPGGLGGTGARSARPRRLVLVFSDCVSGAGGGGGGGGAFWDRLHGWAAATPTVLVNPLPPRIWRHSGLDLPAVRVTPPGAPGARNSALRFTAHTLAQQLYPPPEGLRDAWLPLPVVGLSPRAVSRWARTLMRGDPEGCEAVLVRGPGLPGPAPAPAEPPADAGQLAEAFLHRASTPAVRLAVLCSSYARLHTGLLHVIRQELVPEATAADLAEVVVGGLVFIETPDGAVADGGTADGGPVLSFREGVRERLAPRLGARDALRTREAVSRFIAGHAGAPGGFPALVPDPAGAAGISAAAVPFARASDRTLQGLEAGPRPRLAAPSGQPRPEPPPAVSGRVRAPADDRPYFFLSYAHTPRLGTTGPDVNESVERFFRDLCDEVMALADLPEGAAAGFMDRQIGLGEGWSDRLGHVLATCRVFVPLYSPRYFASETCGKEWFAFAQRSLYERARGVEPVEAIVPALWVLTLPEQMPRVARRVQFDSRPFGEDYTSEGLYALMRLRAFAQEYRQAVHALATRIVEVGESAPLPSRRTVDYLNVPSAFRAATRSEESLRIAVVAPTLRNLPEGRDPRYYGDTPDDWNPYHPESARPLADVATGLAFQLNEQVDVSTLADEVTRVVRGVASSGPLILLVDAWALRVPELRAGLAALDAAREPGTIVLCARHRLDMQVSLYSLESAFPGLTHRSGVALGRAAHGLTTLEAFGAAMPRAVEHAYADYLGQQGDVPPGAPHTPRG